MNYMPGTASLIEDIDSKFDFITWLYWMLVNFSQVNINHPCELTNISFTIDVTLPAGVRVQI